MHTGSSASYDDTIDACMKALSEKKKFLIALCARDSEWKDILDEIINFKFNSLQALTAKNLDSIRRRCPELPRTVTTARNMLDIWMRENPALRSETAQECAAALKWLKSQPNGRPDRVVMAWKKELTQELTKHSTLSESQTMEETMESDQSEKKSTKKKPAKKESPPPSSSSSESDAADQE